MYIGGLRRKPLELDSDNADARNKSSRIWRKSFPPFFLQVFDFISMNVFLNNKSCFIEKEINLSSFLTEIKIDLVRGIAIAINDTIIPKSEWNNKILYHNDKITLITATAGG